jgi:hypothetical protein
MTRRAHLSLLFYSLFPIPYSLPHRDLHHGEHKFPPFRGAIA